MPEHMKRREAVYYFRRVVPKETYRRLVSPGNLPITQRLRTSPSKEWLHIERPL